MQWNAKVDSDQAEIVAAARAWGASVLLLHRVGGGCPDLLLGYHGQDILIECKTEKGELSEAQRDWHKHWHGHPVVVIRSVSQLQKLLLSL